MAKKNSLVIKDGMTENIIRAFGSAVTQKDWFAIAEKAVALAKDGEPAMLAVFLPIIARKMPNAMPDPGEDFPIVPESQVQKFRSQDQPSANA